VTGANVTMADGSWPAHQFAKLLMANHRPTANGTPVTNISTPSMLTHLLYLALSSSSGSPDDGAARAGNSLRSSENMIGSQIKATAAPAHTIGTFTGNLRKNYGN